MGRALGQGPTLALMMRAPIPQDLPPPAAEEYALVHHLGKLCPRCLAHSRCSVSINGLIDPVWLFCS